MYNYPVSLVAGLVAMSFVVISYFLPKKQQYLLFQSGALFCLSVSYLFIEEYFAVIAYIASFIRVAVYYVYERKAKSAPIFIKNLFAVIVIAMFLIVNVGILKNFKWIDVICVVSNVLYTYIFGIRNLKLMRFIILLPTSLALLYNILILATPFVIISYSFELATNVLAILKFDVFGKNKKRSGKNGKTS